jgi:hypothetical protein
MQIRRTDLSWHFDKLPGALAAAMAKSARFQRDPH